MRKFVGWSILVFFGLFFFLGLPIAAEGSLVAGLIESLKVIGAILGYLVAAGLITYALILIGVLE